MRDVMQIPMSAAYAIPLPDAESVTAALKQAREGFTKKLVVLDDDPTGTQTVHDIPVYTNWRKETLCRALLEDDTLLFILTNSRGLSVEETTHVHREFAENLLFASQETGVDFIVLSRSDSTLRGHYPLETEVLRDTLEQSGRIHYDGEIIMPYFREGGRLTIGNVHYVARGEMLIPAGDTEFARDTTFAYRASDLTEWCEERTGGRYPASGVTSISLEELRQQNYESILQKLMAVQDFGKVIVNAADDRDVEVFAAALLQAIAQGREYLFRCAAGLVRVLGGVDHRPLLTSQELRAGSRDYGGLVIVGSHVKKTTDQLDCLLSLGTPLYPICFDVETVFHGDMLERERLRVLRETEEAIRKGLTAVVYTSRKVLRVWDESSQENLNLSVRISQALTSVVGDLTVRPAFLIAKGGITSSDVGIHALRVQKAWVLGQATSGVPVWKTGEESKFPNLSYVIFPGNVGEAATLRDLVGSLIND